ncbi:hypothetical protein P608_06820 [Comamonas thiooxydans]|uniref:Uncharacterized protein n=1 Tax=Comamonas thiooxydans TaxID=363952 RepID=A0A0E3BXE0_9BURK|nr:hypothetical protein P608_06820 [Comamonas thiooxydans]KGH17704.1 hypothetical protein P607_15915 [Comamonas thiooxydans]KGH25076.1 hypothetical protein P606_06460 [Comamonas thiooxydans]
MFLLQKVGCIHGAAHETGAARSRDSEQGPPRSEAVVPLEGEGAKRLRGCFI